MEEVQLDNYMLCDKMEVAETLNKISLMASPATRQRLAARSLEMKMHQHEGEDGDFVPPKELLLYLVRYFGLLFLF